ncbi:MAG: amidase, partial [Pseudomonadota bacterium]
VGRDPEGFPFGLQVVGRFRGDTELLNAAQSLETVLAGLPDLARPKPDLAALATPRPELTSIVTAPPVL